MRTRRFNLRVAFILTCLAASGAIAIPAHAAVSPSGVNWALRHVLALESDDIASGEFNMSCSASTRYGLNVPWTGEQWTRVADAMRGRRDVLGVQIPITQYVVANFMEPDFTPVLTSSSLVFNETFTGALPSWGVYGAYPPVQSAALFVSPSVSARFDTPLASSDGWARRWITQCKEYEVTFWYRLDNVQQRTHLISLTGPMGRAQGIEAQSQTGRLWLREGYFNDELLTPIGSYETGVWRRITFRQIGGRTQVDLGANGSIELDKQTAFLPALATAVVLGDVSTSIYSGSANVDDLILTRWDNTYPAMPRITPIDIKFPDVVAALNDNGDIYHVLCHGLTHGNDAEVQRRYAAGIVDEPSLGEESWWREDYDLVNDNPWGVLYQYGRLTQALDILERAFGHRPTVHVSPGNVYGPDTDAALSMAGLHYHETLTSGAGAASSYEPEVFWSVRTADVELFYRMADPNPVLSATIAAHTVDSLFAIGQPAVLQTHAFNALADGNGAALATFYGRLLDTLAVHHPEIIALTLDEMAGLERDGWSVSLLRANRFMARNYLPAIHEFHVSLPDSMTIQSIRRLPLGQSMVYTVANGEIIFSAGEGDYAIDLVPTVMASVRPGGARGPLLAAGILHASPNPARAATSLVATLPAAGPISLDIVDLQGRRVRELHRGECPDGETRFLWDGRTASGARAAPGLYVARLQWTGGLAQAKILLVP